MDQHRAVNRHYLEHVIALSETHGAEASEDIYADNGMKLLAKSARIDASTRERLLMHRLRKPIEDCLLLKQHISGAQLGREAEALLDQSSLLQSLYNGRSNGETTRNLRDLSLHPKLQTLQTMYAESHPSKLPHAVGASLLCSGLMTKLKPGDTTSQRIVMTAGLSHDIGELYIDPEHLAPGNPMQPDEWRQFAAHPVIAERLLGSMPSVGSQISETVLNHHERLDGFGYPRGIAGENIGLHSQVLAVSELLVGLMESSSAPLKRAHIAVSLVPGEFSRAITDLVAAVCHAGESTEAEYGKHPPIDAQLTRAAKVAGSPDLLKNIGELLLADQPHAALKAVFQQVLHRLNRIQRAFCSTGLDTIAPDDLAEQLPQFGDANTRLEAVLVLQEVAWRLKELGRETVARVSRIAPHETPRAQMLADMLLGAMPVV